MVQLWGGIRRRAFGISADEVDFERRGFWQGDPNARGRLERVGGSFLIGYNVAIEAGAVASTATRLQTVEQELRGFAYEGAAMGFALMDLVLPWGKGRVRSFLRGPGAAHEYMVHVGAGWAAARLGRSVTSIMESLDPLLRWLVVDGYGFSEGYFDWRKYVVERALPSRIEGYGRRAFDQGLGRCLWFVDCADVDRIAGTIGRFDSSRRADLWSGTGLAATYAGGVDREVLERLRVNSGAHGPELAQGAVFAAKVRQRAGNPADHTDLACQVFCEKSADAAARIADDTLASLPSDGTETAYESWRQGIRSCFAGGVDRGDGAVTYQTDSVGYNPPGVRTS